MDALTTQPLAFLAQEALASGEELMNSAQFRSIWAEGNRLVNDPGFAAKVADVVALANRMNQHPAADPLDRVTRAPFGAVDAYARPSFGLSNFGGFAR